MTVKAVKKNIWQIPESSLFLRRDLVLDDGHLLVHGSEKKWYSMEENSPQGIWDHIAEDMLLEFAESGHLIFRATTPLSRVSSKAKDKVNCQYIVPQIIQQLKQFFA